MANGLAVGQDRVALTGDPFFLHAQADQALGWTIGELLEDHVGADEAARWVDGKA